MPSSPHRAVGNRGFTLSELLVAMVIFLTLMSGVLVMFSASVAGVNETYARKDTFEVGRASLDVLARDLQAAFTAREQGDLYNFYGTPNGFMFVGALQDGSLGRVTYAFRETDQIADYQLDSSVLDEPKVLRPLYWLIRYEEPGITNLDDIELPFGYQWPILHPTYSSRDQNPAQPPESNINLYNELLGALRTPDENRRPVGRDLREQIRTLRYSSSGGLHVINEDFTTQLVAAKKRELWINMVAGTGPFTNTLKGENPTNDFFARILNGKGYQIADYALAENILAVLDINEETGIARSTWPMSNGWMGVATRPFFTYAGSDGNTRLPNFNTIKNYNFPTLTQQDRAARGLMPISNLYDSYMDAMTLQQFDRGLANILSGKRGTTTTFGLPLLPRIPALVEANFVVFNPAARVGGVVFEERFSQSIEVPAGLTRGLPPNLAPSPS